MANYNVKPHEGNEGCFKIHRNGHRFELKFSKNKHLTLLAKSDDFGELSDLRTLLYNHYGVEYPFDKMDGEEIKKTAERLMFKIVKGELERIMDERVEFHKDDCVKDLIGSKIMIKKEKTKYPVPGDFIIFHGADKTKNDLGIVANVNGEDYFVFIETGSSFIMEELADTDWRFATATVEAS